MSYVITGSRALHYSLHAEEPHWLTGSAGGLGTVAEYEA